MSFTSLRSATVSASAANTFSSSVQFDSQTYFLISIEGTFVATVSLQRSLNGGTTWYTVATFTGATEEVCLSVDNSVLWRIGVATGNYTSGTVAAQISQ